LGTRYKGNILELRGMKEGNRERFTKGNFIAFIVHLLQSGAKPSWGYLIEKSHGPNRSPYANYPLSASDVLIGLRAGLP